MDETKQQTIHRDLAILEVAEAGLLEPLYAISALRPYLWLRLDERRVLVPTKRGDAIAAILQAEGFPPTTSRKL